MRRAWRAWRPLQALALVVLTILYYHWRLQALSRSTTPTIPIRILAPPGTKPVAYFSGVSRSTGEAWMLLDTVRYPMVISKDVLEGADPDAAGSTGYRYVIGIPTVQREQFDYLRSTLNSVLMGLGIEEIKQAVTTKKFILVVQIGDEDMVVTRQRSLMVEERYGRLIQNGVLEIIKPSRTLYKDLHSISDPGTRWNAKQALDFAHLMLYSASKGDYYLHLEDDCSAEAGFLQKMDNFIHELQTEQWLSIDFTGGGLLGKLFRTSDLYGLVNHFLSSRSPDTTAEELYRQYANTVHRPCDLSLRTIDSTCIQELGLSSIQYKPSLFQHLGTYSSNPAIESAAETKRDANTPVGSEPYPWEDVPVYVNPRARVWTSMTEVGEHTVRSAYDLSGYLLVERPRAGDVAFVNFTPPVNLEEFFLRSYHSGHPGARFLSSTYLDVLPVSPAKFTPPGPNPNLFECDFVDHHYIKVGRFNERGIAEGPLGEDFGAIASVRLRVEEDHSHKAVLREMVFKVQVVPSSVRPCCQARWPDPFQQGIPGYQPLDS